MTAAVLLLLASVHAAMRARTPDLEPVDRTPQIVVPAVIRVGHKLKLDRLGVFLNQYEEYLNGTRSYSELPPSVYGSSADAACDNLIAASLTHRRSQVPSDLPTAYQARAVPRPRPSRR